MQHVYIDCEQFFESRMIRNDILDALLRNKSVQTGEIIIFETLSLYHKI